MIIDNWQGKVYKYEFGLSRSELSHWKDGIEDLMLVRVL